MLSGDRDSPYVIASSSLRSVISMSLPPASPFRFGLPLITFGQKEGKGEVRNSSF